MKHIITLFIMAMAISCSGNGQDADTTFGVGGDDSIMVAKGYEKVRIQKTRS